MRQLAVLLILTGSHFLVEAQQEQIKSYITKQVEGEAPVIDGTLDDQAWDLVPWGGGDFVQVSPYSGSTPSFQTTFKILYDDKNLYVAIKNYDSESDKITKRMSRRDGFDGDYVELDIDSYYDKRTAFSFTSSVSGVKSDGYVFNNGDNVDYNWDPIWYLRTSIDEEGWIAEIKIPLSQLRFANRKDHTWGLQITRRFFRNQERSSWQFIPQDAGGWVHLMGELKGLRGIKPQNQLEIQPYLVARTERFQKEEGNPFLTGKSSELNYGLDAKIGITSDVTLDLTVNPDFGQVEADPSQVNLSAFQVYFPEQRPFFIEGRNVLSFSVPGFGNTDLFYSRRIGRAPQGTVETDQNDVDDGVAEYVKRKNNTAILGAAKLTGKNKRGFSWGLLESLTAREVAEVDSLGSIGKVAIEPQTNYFVTRGQQEINKGNTIVGGIFTATNRKIDDRNLDWLHDQAYSGGIDFTHNWKHRTYYVNAKTLISQVKGSPESIARSQESSERYFQRPDNNHADVDTTRTSLTGTGGTLSIGKQSGRLLYEAGYSWLSPEFEINDIGFMPQTDVMNQWLWTQYRILRPSSVFRSQRYSASQHLGLDFDGKVTSRYYDANTNMQFKNFWSLSSGMSLITQSVSNADLRGGPALHYPGNYGFWLWASTDGRKKFQMAVGPSARWGFDSFLDYKGIDFQFNYRPINSLSISLSPSLSSRRNEMQYVTTGAVEGENRFVVAEIDQMTARLALRMTYMIKPNLSLQYWGQPFGTYGNYSNFKYISDASADEYQQRFIPVPDDQIALKDDVYAVDENKDGAADFTFDNPDFNVGQFRSNMVLRWEYIPSSALFLVWTQNMNGAFNDTGTLTNFNFDSKAHNIFLMKLTYRFVL
ncbi:MAG TPA: DUF5916 domain-containing protein [Cyclobacteriaceae bacterium]|nr:DUF5916 domain-containing protein [Cyclobacteriaceae bacterium]